jgi:hypothetical protein
LILARHVCLMRVPDASTGRERQTRADREHLLAHDLGELLDE